MPGSPQIEWNTGAAAHLLRRGVFGGTPEDAGRLAALGLDGAVERILAGDGSNPAPPPPTDIAELAKRRELRKAKRNKVPGSEAEGVRFNREVRRRLEELRFWWLERMRTGAVSAGEKLALFWHGHFATSVTKVRSNHLMMVQNDVFRKLGAGPFRELCAAMARDAAMLVWLDGRDNKAKAPNENFAREILELFALGEGKYSENDIREAARCFTGWRVRPENGEAFFVQKQHDSGRKTLFGKTGVFGDREAVEIICAQPRCAEFLVRKLWEFYAYPDPDPKLVESLVAHYRSHDLHTGELLRMMFKRPEFYSSKARARQIKSPVQWLVQSARETNRQLLPPGVALPLAAELGQNLFMPPSVKGWDGGTAWINSATLIRRSNTALLLATAAPPLPWESLESMDSAAWLKVAPPETRAGASLLAGRLQEVFLAGAPAPATRHKLDALLGKRSFPCDDDTVRQASIILMGSPEYNLC
jgi:uncharacterized protein (DUF1800 family)